LGEDRIKSAAGSLGAKKKEGRDESRPYTFKLLIIGNLVLDWADLGSLDEAFTLPKLLKVRVFV
jgi:hypothetical protein